MDKAITKANMYFYKKQYKKAAILYEQSLKDDPTDVMVLAKLADCFYNMAQNNFYRQKTVEICNKITEISPNTAKPYIIFSYLANDLVNQRFFAEKALSLEPDSPEVVCCYGILLLDEGKYTEAVSYLEKAVLIEPEMHLAQHNLLVAFINVKDIDNQYKQSKILLYLFPSFQNLSFFLSSYFEKNRIFFFFLLLTPLLYIWFPFNLFFIIHLIFLFFYSYEIILSIRNKSTNSFSFRRNLLFIVLILILDLGVICFRWASGYIGK